MSAPQRIELFPGQWAEAARQQKIIAMQSEILRISCYDVIHALTEALRHPGICRREIETAMAALPRAYAAACQLDPKEDEEL